MENKRDFLDKMNIAFADCNTEFIAANVTEDIKWVIIGEKTISGIEDFKESLEKMSLGGPLEIVVKDMIITGHKALVEGVVKMKKGPNHKNKYAFCDVYIFDNGSDNMVKELRTYITRLKNE